MRKSRERHEALVYHAKPKPGKIEVIPTKKYTTQHDLSLAYSPGVAEPCLEIKNDVKNVYKYTSKGNLVAVISNGTAVLGLGDIGAEASKPVMEGKGLLFKIFADIDVFDIEIDTKDPDKFIETVKHIAPTFGGINLEDIKAPEAFEIERRLKEELDIPVMHDDQHGTAIISAAALKNAVEIAGKKMEDIKIVVSGAGSAAVSCSTLYLSLGVKAENITMFDVNGVLSKDRTDLIDKQRIFATDKKYNSLAEAMVGTDVFLGLSVGGIVTGDMVKSMAKNPIVFAMANPNPEISYDEATSAREDIIMATGRSDYPNQVNNVLGFPYIFRGALDVKATKINEAMKLAAVKAIAELAKKSVPEQVNLVYDEVNLSYGKDYILPKPFDPRLIYEISPAVAKAAMESGVAQEPIEDWNRYKAELMDRSGYGSKEIRLLHDRAKRSNKKRVVFAEADHLDVLKAAQRVYEIGIAKPILLGDRDTILELKEELGFDVDVPIIDPRSKEEKEQRIIFANTYWKKHQRKGVTLLDAKKAMRDRNYFASMMVNEGMADAMISGYTKSYANTIKPIFEIIEKEEGVNRVCAANLMLTKKGPLFLADTTLNLNPNAEELANITHKTCNLAKIFGINPVVAMVGFSNFGSSKTETSKKIRKAVEYMHKNHPELIVDGEMQVDFALNPELLNEKFPFSKLNGHKVNTLIFPNLESANISYNMLRQVTKTESIGPIILGFKKPIHVVQFGASVDEMVNMAAVAVVDAQNKSKKNK